MGIKDAIIRAFINRKAGDPDFAEVTEPNTTELDALKERLSQVIDKGLQENIFDDHREDIGQRDMDQTLHSLFDDSGKDLEANKGKSIYNTGQFQVLDSPAVYQNVEFNEQDYEDHRGAVIGNLSFAAQANQAAPDYNPDAILGSTPRKLQSRAMLTNRGATSNDGLMALHQNRLDGTSLQARNLPGNVKTEQQESSDVETRVTEYAQNPQGIVKSFVQRTSHTRTITQYHKLDGSVEQIIEDKNISEDVERNLLDNGNVQETVTTNTQHKTTKHSTQALIGAPSNMNASVVEHVDVEPVSKLALTTPQVTRALAAPAPQEQQTPVSKSTANEDSFAALFEKEEYFKPSFAHEAEIIDHYQPVSSYALIESPHATMDTQNREKLAQYKQAVKNSLPPVSKKEDFASLLDRHPSQFNDKDQQLERQNLASKRKKAKMFAPGSGSNLRPQKTNFSHGRDLAHEHEEAVKRVVAGKFADLVDSEIQEVAYEVDRSNEQQQRFNQSNSFAQLFEAKNSQQKQTSKFVAKDDSFAQAFADINPYDNNSTRATSLQQQRRQAELERKARAGIKSGKEIIEQQLAQEKYDALQNTPDVVFSDIHMRFNAHNYEHARFAAEDLDPDVLHAFMNNLLPIQREVDLHGVTVEELKNILPNIVKQCWRHNEFVLRFITGHGKDVIKQSLPNYLIQYERIAAFYPNRENNGKGRTNGFVVLLRNYDKEIAANASLLVNKA
ncbi:Smr/MutS family protein [Psittacicella hinzii]|uniref:Smr domain-containing protein n=1 Tax=Psittacicella hinzii TaxID=2028575 RepID=A0A3A1YUV7_9GAMM|nr:Smr/MutS family protein [Psittacicella hinzii]RIY40620.1 hypothetical protein CKF58_00440 [Psittacicella hinzii]